MSVSTSGAERDDAWLVKLERIAGWGFEGVELCVGEPRDLDSMRAMRGHLTRLGLQATVAGSAKPSVGLERHVRDLIDACAVLDARVLCGPLPFGGDRAGAAMLAGAAEYAGDLGVTIALGGLDHGGQHRARTVAETSRLVDAAAAPNAGVLYNTYQAHVEESSIGGAVLSAGARLRHVQIVENDGAAPGQGQVGWAETFAALDAIGYDGWYVIDAKHPGDAEAIALAGLHFLRRHRRGWLGCNCPNCPN